jgi:hypothetical protein
MNKMNGQSFIAQKLGLKCSQGSESLFGGRVKHLLAQGIGQDGAVPIYLQAELRRGAALVCRDADDRRKPALAGL